MIWIRYGNPQTAEVGRRTYFNRAEKCLVCDKEIKAKRAVYYHQLKQLHPLKSNDKLHKAFLPTRLLRK